MIAAGIDLGGTKIEAQLFDESWSAIGHKRIATPKTYDALVQAVADQIAWTEEQSGHALPVGIGAAGLVNPKTGLALTANLCASGQPFPKDIAKAAGRPVTYVNDCRALALSEAVFGAGRGHRTVMSLILGTGIGGGIAVDGVLFDGPSMTGGEFGHTSAPAHLVAANGLPIVTCGCGRDGCAETYIAGPGLERLAKTLTGADLTTQEIASQKTGDMHGVWTLWCDLVADLLRNLTLTIDPDVIIIGGGLSQIDGVIADLSDALHRARIGDFAVPGLLLAQGGETSGARGAAYAAIQEAA